MTTYQELLQRRQELDQQIEVLRKSELKDAIEKARAVIADFGLTVEDVFGKPKSAVAGQKVAPKYKDAATGATWTGRGKPPKWIDGKNREEFLIAA